MNPRERLREIFGDNPAGFPGPSPSAIPAQGRRGVLRSRFPGLTEQELNEVITAAEEISAVEE